VLRRGEVAIKGLGAREIGPGRPVRVRSSKIRTRYSARTGPLSLLQLYNILWIQHGTSKYASTPSSIFVFSAFSGSSVISFQDYNSLRD